MSYSNPSQPLHVAMYHPPKYNGVQLIPRMRCAGCGCTDEQACIGPGGLPCSWVRPNWCSECQRILEVGQARVQFPVPTPQPFFIVMGKCRTCGDECPISKTQCHVCECLFRETAKVKE